MKKIKKHIRLILGIILLLVGIGFMVIPFIPLGYIIIFIAAFFLATYIPPLNRFLEYLKKKDKKGRLKKVEEKVEGFEEKIEDEDDSKKKEKDRHKDTSEEAGDIHIEKKKDKGTGKDSPT